MAVTPSPTHTHLWFMGADIGWDERACNKQMFSWIGILGQGRSSIGGRRDRN